ncbi:unnamed protein product [Closterium sp. NIES-64]|nr:unnamed protein product [Closterium sp. NIES-64]
MAPSPPLSAAPSPPPPFQRPRRRPFSGPVAALSAAPSPPFQRPRRRPLSGLVAALSAASSPPLSGLVAALQRPRRRPLAAPSPPLSVAPSPPLSAAPSPPLLGLVAAPFGGLVAVLQRPQHRLCHCTALPHCAHCLSTAVMATLSVLTFDAEGRAVDFEVWVDDMQLFLQCDRTDGLSLFDLTSGASRAPAADADATVRSQWATRDAAARLAVRRHLLTAERAHFSQYMSAKTLYGAVVARYSSPATAALSRLILPYLFPDLAAFPTVADLITHLRTSVIRYRAALLAELCAKNPPPMYIILYYIVTRLPDTLRSVRDHFFSVCPTTLTGDLLEERLLAAEKSIVAVGASRGDPRTPVFEGCSPSPLLPFVASAAAADLVGLESVGAASAPSGRRRSGKGKEGKGTGGAGGGVEAEEAAVVAVRAEVAEVKAVVEVAAAEVELVGAAGP